MAHAGQQQPQPSRSMGIWHLARSPQLVRHKCLAGTSLFSPSIHPPLSPMWPIGHVHGMSYLSIVVCDMHVWEFKVDRCTVRLYGRAAYTGMCIVVPVRPVCLCCGEQSVHGVRLAHAVTTPPPQPDVATRLDSAAVSSSMCAGAC
jgi:hypothetical protein